MTMATITLATTMMTMTTMTIMMQNLDERDMGLVSERGRDRQRDASANSTRARFLLLLVAPSNVQPQHLRPFASRIARDANHGAAQDVQGIGHPTTLYRHLSQRPMSKR